LSRRHFIFTKIWLNRFHFFIYKWKLLLILTVMVTIDMILALSLLIGTHSCINRLVVCFKSVIVLNCSLIVGFTPLVCILDKSQFLIFMSFILIFKHDFTWRLFLIVLVLVIIPTIYHLLLNHLLLCKLIVLYLSLTAHRRKRLVSVVWYSMTWIIEIAIIHLLIVLEAWC
jgi:hypothetical protein